MGAEVLTGLFALMAAALGIALWRERARRLASAAHAQELESQLGKMQQSQAQVIHTTKLASLGQMIAGVAHEMNTPIGFVKSNVEVVRELMGEYRELLAKVDKGFGMLLAADLARPGAVEAVRKGMEKLRGALASDERLKDSDELLKDSVDGLVQIANLVKNLKGFARVDQDGMDLMDVNESVESALVIAAHQLRDRIEVRRELGTIPRIRGVASQINQVLLNLITNAAQAMGDAGTLSVASRRSGDQIEVDVTDSGPGIPDDVLPKIFDPFFTTKPVGEGTGLGLSIVHKIVQSHGGAIKVRTAAGKGTTFTVSFPIDHALLKQPG
jgi:signal transduction histidine kinase